MLVFWYQKRRYWRHPSTPSWLKRKWTSISSSKLQGSCLGDKVQNENKKQFLWNDTFLSACVPVVFTDEELKAVTTGSFFFFGAHWHATVFKEKAWALFSHEASCCHQETGSRLLLLSLALFAGCWECCLSALPKVIAVYDQLQPGRLSNDGVPLVRNRAETPCSGSSFPVNRSLRGILVWEFTVDRL